MLYSVNVAHHEADLLGGATSSSVLLTRESRCLCRLRPFIWNGVILGIWVIIVLKQLPCPAGWVNYSLLGLNLNDCPYSEVIYSEEVLHKIIKHSNERKCACTNLGQVWKISLFESKPETNNLYKYYIYKLLVIISILIIIIIIIVLVKLQHLKHYPEKLSLHVAPAHKPNTL